MSAGLESCISPTASPMAVSSVPVCATLRRSLSSDAAASLNMAFTRTATVSGSRVESNHSEHCGAPPCSIARSRTIRADSILSPDAALARVLARIILVCFTAFGGRSEKLGDWNTRASRSASGAFTSLNDALIYMVSKPRRPIRENYGGVSWWAQAPTLSPSLHLRRSYLRCL